MPKDQITYENITEIIKEKYPHVTSRLIRSVTSRDIRHLCLDRSFKRVIFNRVSLIGVMLIDEKDKTISESAVFLYSKQCKTCKMVYYKIIGHDAGYISGTIVPPSLILSNLMYDINHPTNTNIN